MYSPSSSSVDSSASYHPGSYPSSESSGNYHARYSDPGDSGSSSGFSSDSSGSYDSSSSIYHQGDTLDDPLYVSDSDENSALVGSGSSAVSTGRTYADVVASPPCETRRRGCTQVPSGSRPSGGSSSPRGRFARRNGVSGPSGGSVSPQTQSRQRRDGSTDDEAVRCRVKRVRRIESSSDDDEG